MFHHSTEYSWRIDHEILLYCSAFFFFTSLYEQSSHILEIVGRDIFKKLPRLVIYGFS